MKSKPLSSFPTCFCFSPCRQVPALSSCFPKWNMTWIWKSSKLFSSQDAFGLDVCSSNRSLAEILFLRWFQAMSIHTLECSSPEIRWFLFNGYRVDKCLARNYDDKFDSLTKAQTVIFMGIKLKKPSRICAVNMCGFFSKSASFVDRYRWICLSREGHVLGRTEELDVLSCPLPCLM